MHPSNLILGHQITNRQITGMNYENAIPGDCQRSCYPKSCGMHEVYSKKLIRSVLFLFKSQRGELCRYGTECTIRISYLEIGTDHVIDNAHIHLNEVSFRIRAASTAIIAITTTTINMLRI